LNLAILEKSSSKAEQKGLDGGSSQPRKNNRKKTARMEGEKDKTDKQKTVGMEQQGQAEKATERT
jgi:hypothetical protein